MRYLGIAILTFALAGCGPDIFGPSSPDSSSDQASVRFAEDEGALTPAPTLSVTGLQSVFDVLKITNLSFKAELFLLPVDVENQGAGDAVAVEFDLSQDVEKLEVTGRPIRLAAAGAYRVLLRVQPSMSGVSVDVVGEIRTPIVILNKAEEPAPTAAEPAPTAAREAKCEPAPTAASETDEAQEEAGDENEIIEANEDDCAEPAPTAADEMEEAEETYEPAPTAARDAEEAEAASAEPARQLPNRLRLQHARRSNKAS